MYFVESALSIRDLLGISLVVMSGAASAHHSYAMFDSTQTLTLQGTVKEFQWTNPHCFIQVLVPGGDGMSREWSIEMSGPAGLYRQGWRPGSLKAGDKVTVKIHPDKDGSNGGWYVSAVGPDGKPLFAEES
jgi:hypothetical protein